ncbi:MAG: hypothetical protein K2N03_07615 [Muribaculaceae bacterium]|nr:hypothetical protein [Muribaculaceae bacterium]
MAIFLIILSVLLWIGAIVTLPKKALLSPALSFVGLLVISLARRDGFQIIPVNNTILTGWLCMTVVVMLATYMQPVPVRNSARGTGYIIIGGLMGLMLGLLGFTFSSNLSMLYSVMIVGVIAGVFFGFLLFSRTPGGDGINMQSGHFFKYLFAKGFPTAITLMQIGVVLVIVVALNQLNP